MSEELKSTCAAAGVKRLVFVRHAAAAPPGATGPCPPHHPADTTMNFSHSQMRIFYSFCTWFQCWAPLLFPSDCSLC
jgi:hypothetical protein